VKRGEAIVEKFCGGNREAVAYIEINVKYGQEGGGFDFLLDICYGNYLALSGSLDITVKATPRYVHVTPLIAAVQNASCNAGIRVIPPGA